MKLKSKYYCLIVGVIVILGGLIFVYFSKFQKDVYSPQNLKCTIEDFAIKLYWKKPLVNEQVTYNIYKKSEHRDKFKKIAEDINQTEYHDKTETDPYVNYNYYVTAKDSSGRESLSSNIVTCRIHQARTFPLLKKALAAIAIGTVEPDSSFTADNLLFDADFINTGAFSANEIQSFLESKNSILATIEPNRLCGTPPEECDNIKTPAELIYEAANLVLDSQSYGVNPAVILVTLQKEQGLITGSSEADFPYGLQYALDWAMGYAVFEDGTRIEALKGFRQQLLGGEDDEGNFWWGAPRSMRNNYKLGRGPNVNSLCRAYGDEPKTPSYFEGHCYTFEVTNSTYYYDVPSKQKVTPENKSTMALYRYTPHVFNGNYNFWYFWNYWFGSIYNIKIRYQLKINTASLVEGNLLKASFSIKNYNKISMKLDRLKVDVRGTGDPQDIYGVSNITIGPGETFSFYNPPEGVKIYNKRVLTDTGSYNARIKMLYKGGWYSVPGAVSKDLTVRKIKSTDLYLNPNLSLSPTSIYEGEEVTGSFTIFNKTNAPLLLERLKVTICDASVCYNKKAYDLLGYSRKIIGDSLTFSENNSRIVEDSGTYNAGVRIKLNGKWLIPSGNVEKKLEVKPKIEAISIRYQLKINTASLVEGNLLKASFAIKNNANVDIILQRLKVDVRGTGDPQDIYGVSNITIGPNQTFSFYNPPEGVKIYNKRVLTDTGSYNAKIKMLYKGGWYSVPGAVSKDLTIRAIKSTDLYLNPNLSLSPTSIYEGEEVTGTFTIYNKTNAPLFLQRLKVSVWEGKKYYDLLGHSNEYLRNSIIFSKNNSRTIYEAGTYNARVNVKVNGKWFVPSGNVDKILEVSESPT